MEFRTDQGPKVSYKQNIAFCLIGSRRVICFNVVKKSIKCNGNIEHECLATGTVKGGFILGVKPKWSWRMSKSLMVDYSYL